MISKQRVVELNLIIYMSFQAKNGQTYHCVKINNTNKTSNYAVNKSKSSNVN